MILLLFTLFCLYLFNECYWKRRRLPPGPVPLPILGNVLSYALSPPGYQPFIDWKKTFGPIYTYWLGTTPTIIVADYNVMKETFIKDGAKYTGRIDNDYHALFRGGHGYGIFNSEGENWRELRRFVLQALRDFGMGKNVMEQKILFEVEVVLERIAKRQGCDIHVHRQFDLAIGSLINNILFGHRYDEENEDEFNNLMRAIQSHVKLSASVPVLLTLTNPWLRNFPFVKDTYDQAIVNRNIVFGTAREKIRTVRAQINFDKESENLAECFLKEQKKRAGDSSARYFDEPNFENICVDLWIAGIDTTSNTLIWAIAFMLNFDGIQDNIHAELDRVIKSRRMITMADKSKLNYLNATICEIQRFVNLLPINLIHKTLEDVEICRHKISANTLIIPQISTVLYDETVFPEANKFNPERFLNADGTLKRVDEFVPFFIGKRNCIGEALAKMELFLFLANIFQRFKVTSDEKPSLRKSRSIVVSPEHFVCKFEERL